MTNYEQIAAKWIFEHLPNSQSLPYERLISLFRDNLLFTRNKKCYCNDSRNQAQKIPIIFPIFPSEGEASKGLYSSIPLSYISWVIPSNALPCIEVIETPVFFPDLIFHAQEKDEIEKKLLPQGKVVIGSFKKITDPISYDDLKKIRIRALSKILEISDADANIYLSIFPEMPKKLVEDGVSRYQKDFEVSQKMDSGEFQSKRIMPIMFHKKLVVFTLNCWILTKKDLNI
jgi:hypothetical protein